MNGYTKLSHDFAALAENLGRIERDRQERQRRIAEQRQLAAAESLQQRRKSLVQKALWWVSPASWAVVFVAGFFVTDWVLDRLDFFLTAIGL
jgi:hypothetical protein